MMFLFENFGNGLRVVNDNDEHGIKFGQDFMQTFNNEEENQ